MLRRRPLRPLPPKPTKPASTKSTQPLTTTNRTPKTLDNDREPRNYTTNQHTTARNKSRYGYSNHALPAIGTVKCLRWHLRGALWERVQRTQGRFSSSTSTSQLNALYLGGVGGASKSPSYNWPSGSSHFRLQGSHYPLTGPAAGPAPAAGAGASAFPPASAACPRSPSAPCPLRSGCRSVV